MTSGTAGRRPPRAGTGGVLAGLPPEVRDRVVAASALRRVRRGTTLFHEGDPGDTFLLVEGGHVAIRTTSRSGDVVTLTVLGPGDAFGEGALLWRDERRTASAVALDEVEVRVWTRARLDELRHGHPELDRALLELVAGQVRRLTARLAEAHHLDAESRVVRRLAEVAATFAPEAAADGGPSSVATVPLTQSDLASLAGTGRPTVNRVLRGLESGGVVALARGRVDVLDLPRLIERAGGADFDPRAGRG